MQVLGEVLTLGRDPEADLVIPDLRVRPSHARLRQVKGEWVLSAVGDAPLWVNGRAAPLFPLRAGDRVALVGPEAVEGAFHFEDALAGAFVPPGTSRLAAWAAVASARGRSARLDSYGVEVSGSTERAFEREAELPAGTGPSGWTGRARLLVGAPRPLPTDLGGGLEAAVRQAGAPHPGLAHVLEVGVWSDAAGHRPWLAHVAPLGRRGTDLVAEAPLGVGAWLRTMADLARALAWLHRRGVLHGALGPSAVVVDAEGGAHLLPSLGSHAWRGGGAAAPLAVRTPGFIAAEEEGGAAGAPGPALDVHDLCAFGVACWVGRWDEERAARAHAQRAVRRGRVRVVDLGLTLPTELEQLLDQGLARVPAERPNAADVARRLEGLVALWGQAPAGLGTPGDPS